MENTLTAILWKSDSRAKSRSALTIYRALSTRGEVLATSLITALRLILPYAPATSQDNSTAEQRMIRRRRRISPAQS